MGSFLQRIWLKLELSLRLAYLRSMLLAARDPEKAEGIRGLVRAYHLLSRRL